MKKIIICTIATAIFASCNQNIKKEDGLTLQSINEQKHIPNQTAISLNDSAVGLLMKTIPFQDSANTELNRKALKYLNKAIKADSLYQLLYSNKVDVLKNLGRYEEAIKTLNNAARVISGYAEAYAVQAFLYEKMDKLDSANFMYSQALKANQRRIGEEPKNINHQINLAFLLLFTEGKTEALYEIEDIIEKTNDEQAIEFKAFIKSFNRDQFIVNY
jgi:tetratricopeptide (TPR) repeat protein